MQNKLAALSFNEVEMLDELASRGLNYKRDWLSSFSRYCYICGKYIKKINQTDNSSLDYGTIKHAQKHLQESKLIGFL